jgi:hypothetical protein
MWFAGRLPYLSSVPDIVFDTSRAQRVAEHAGACVSLM